MVFYAFPLYIIQSFLLFVFSYFFYFLASFYYSNTEEERQILIYLPKLKGFHRFLILLSLEAHPSQRRALLWKKLLICGIRFDFSHEGEEVARDIKRNTLLELMDASESMGYSFLYSFSYSIDPYLMIQNVYKIH